MWFGVDAPMEFEIKCHLGYEVSGPASFLFNVAVAQNSFQRIITEHFDLAGADSRQEMVIGGQRYHRVTAQSGSVELVYEAVVDAPHVHTIATLARQSQWRSWFQ
jgi:hypothetical protein